MSTLQRLQSLAKTAPVLNQEAAARASEAQRIQARQAMGAAAPGTNIRQLQAAAPQVQQAAAAPQLAAAQQTQAQQAALGQQALQTQAQQAQTAQQLSGIAQATTLSAEQRAAQAAVQQAGLAQQTQQTAAEAAQQARLGQHARETDKSVNFLTRKQQSDLAKLGRDVKQELHDKRMEFERDEDGRKYANTIQLLDYTRATAKSEDELSDRLQLIEQRADRASAMLRVAYAKVEAKLQQDYEAAVQAGDHTRRKYVADKQRELAEQKAAAAHEAEKTKNRVTTAFATGGYSEVANLAGRATGQGNIGTESLERAIGLDDIM